MNRRRRVLVVCALAAVAGGVAHIVDAHSRVDSLIFLAAGVLLGELLALRLEDRSALPLSYAAFVLIASSFTLREFAFSVLGAEVATLALRLTDQNLRWRIANFALSLAVAATTYGAYQGAWRLVGRREDVAPVLVALGAAAAAQLVVDVVASKLFRLGASLTPRGRLAWMAIASSGMLMAIGYRGVGGSGRLGLWGTLLFSTPLLATWYAFERLDAANRSYRQTIEALAMAPELGGLVPPGHAERVATLASAMGEHLGLAANDVRDLEMAALLHHLGQVTLDHPLDEHGVDPGEVTAVTGAMLSEIRPLAPAGEIVTGDIEDPKRRLAVQALRLASEYDDLTARDHVPGDLAVESLRSAPSYVYDERVVVALERVLRDRLSAAS